MCDNVIPFPTAKVRVHRTDNVVRIGDRVRCINDGETGDVRDTGWTTDGQPGLIVCVRGFHRWVHPDDVVPMSEAE